MITSSSALHASTPFLNTGQRCIAHLWYCNRDRSHGPAHVPSPSAFSSTHFRRSLVPPSHRLLQLLHLLHLLSTQSFSHDCGLHCLVSDVAGQGVPSYLAARVTTRSRC
jgi:hypothetical protein